jgi:hypothetical protein
LEEADLGRSIDCYVVAGVIVTCIAALTVVRKVLKDNEKPFIPISSTYAGELMMPPAIAAVVQRMWASALRLALCLLEVKQ